jgi:hypothetical protein
MRPYLKKKKKSQKRACGVAQGIGLDFKKIPPQKEKKYKYIHIYE